MISLSRYVNTGEIDVQITTKDTEITMPKQIRVYSRKNLTIGDQVFDNINAASSFCQIDVVSSDDITGTLTVVYSPPNSTILKTVKDSNGADLTINLADPRVVSITGLHVGSIGVRPTVAVAGGKYDLTLVTESDGDVTYA